MKMDTWTWSGLVGGIVGLLIGIGGVVLNAGLPRIQVNGTIPVLTWTSKRCTIIPPHWVLMQKEQLVKPPLKNTRRGKKYG